MTARRTLSPAARGVVLAVRAALRAGRVDLADQADGSTLATSTAPDGIVLLHAVLRMPVPGAADPRQLTLPAVAPVPQPAEVPPAPVAVPAGEEREPEAPAPQGSATTVRLWLWRGDLERADEDTRAWLLEPIEESFIEWERQPGGWISATLPAGSRETRTLRSICQRAQISLHEGDDAPTRPAEEQPEAAQERERTPLAPGDLIEMDGARVRVAHVDHEGFTWAEVDRQGFSVGEVERCLWREVEQTAPGVWRILPVNTETPAAKAKREAAAAKPKRTAKAKPARLTPVPEADALARHGERSVVAQLHEGDAWGLVWSDKLPGQMAYEVAVQSVMEQAHAARIYDRGQHCVRDSRDGAA